MKTKPFANVKSPLIEAVIEQSYSFSKLEQATEVLETLKKQFVMSKHQVVDNEIPSAMMWIHGFDISEDEEGDGCIGNYGIISAIPTDGDKYTLTVKKIVREMKFHPQRKMKKGKHPNWGHPVMRAIKSGKRYNSIEDVRAVLKQLHEDYPTVTIPCTNKTYTMVYSKTTKPPVKKYVLEVKITEDGHFYIDCNLNEYKKPYKVKEETPEPTGFQASKQQLRSRQVVGEIVEEKIKGKFTAMIEKKRK